MTTLADKSLLSGGDNKPPMLEKHLYDSWKSRMELYMLNRPHGRMILASVEKGPLVWPSITVDGVTRLKEYIELTPTEAIQADCDIKAINIILQGLPTEIYALKKLRRKLRSQRRKSKKKQRGRGGCRIPIIKVRWNLHRGPEFTWEWEDQFKRKYHHLFSSNQRSSKSKRALGRRSFKEGML
ncbi:hypothetical protein Tco_0238661 [Tanacetum coccineum]